ncbi:MAG TPA: hypothetical protein VGF44_00920, partial [Terriglobales bacterium]
MRLLSKTGPSTRRRLASIGVSAAIHLVCLAWILYVGAPRLLTASSKVAGNGNSFIAHLYWPNQKNAAANNALGTGQSYKQAMERARKQLQLQAKLRVKPKV